jgi:hypothetical protein
MRRLFVRPKSPAARSEGLLQTIEYDCDDHFLYGEAMRRLIVASQDLTQTPGPAGGHSAAWRADKLQAFSPTLIESRFMPDP